MVWLQENEKKNVWHVYSFRQNIWTWQTDRRTDRQPATSPWHKLYRALILHGLALCLPSASVSSVLMVLYRYKKFYCLHPSLYLLVSWAWWDWPLTWLTNHRPSVLWLCWLGHVTRKTVSEMTYNVSSGTFILIQYSFIKKTDKTHLGQKEQ